MPGRLRDIKRVAISLGAEVVEPSSGSHWKVIGSGVCFPLAAHGGLKSEISDIYIRALCRTFGWDFDEFKRQL
jgi:hypothetical protein